MRIFIVNAANFLCGFICRLDIDAVFLGNKHNFKEPTFVGFGNKPLRSRIRLVLSTNVLQVATLKILETLLKLKARNVSISKFLFDLVTKSHQL